MEWEPQLLRTSPHTYEAHKAMLVVDLVAWLHCDELPEAMSLVVNGTTYDFKTCEERRQFAQGLALGERRRFLGCRD